MSPRRLAALIGAAAVLLGGYAGADHLALEAPGIGSAETDTPTANHWEGRTATRSEITALLDEVKVISTRPEVDGYDRECGTDHACTFGQAWTDETTAEMGGNGCDQRNDMLRASLQQVELEPGSDCVVVAGTLADPYTGEQISFTKDNAHDVQIDHLYPLARAYDMGAADWPLEKRIKFATDPLNLLAADGPANASKSDQGPGEWMPINEAYRCTYVARYLEVATSYDLPITESSADAIKHTADGCPTGSASAE